MALEKPTVFGSHEPNTLAQLEDVASRAERAALMADGHLGYVMPIGGVAADRDTDESPHVYRRLPDVLEAQGATVEVLHTLRPQIVVMAGADEFDPYKD